MLFFFFQKEMSKYLKISKLGTHRGIKIAWYKGETRNHTMVKYSEIMK